MSVRGSNIRSLPFYVLMIGPALVLYLGIVAYPILSSIYLGFTNYNLFDPAQTEFVGFKHYQTMFADPLFWQAFSNNMIVVAVSVFLQIPIGFILAYILYRKGVRATGFFQSMVFLPNFISTVVVGILWKRIFGADGPAAKVLQFVTGDPSAQITWGLSTETAMIPIAFALVWMYTGFYMIIFLANLQKIDPGLIEAAQIDGASEFQIFGRIVSPMLTGIILVNSILAIAGSLKGFDLIFAMTGGGPANNTIVLPIYMYNFAFKIFSDDAYSFGSAISNVIVLISILLIVVANFVGKKIRGKVAD